MQIAHVMTKKIQTCRASDSLARAAQLMWDHDIGTVAVVDEHGQLVGMVTDRDCCMAAYLRGQPLAHISVSVAMTNHVVSCTLDDSDVVAATLMSKHRVRRIPVVDDAQRPIGIVSINDLAIAMAEGSDVPAIEVAGTLAAISQHRTCATA
jgi:CBS domain-containing protein